MGNTEIDGNWKMGTVVISEYKVHPSKQAVYMKRERLSKTDVFCFTKQD